MTPPDLHSEETLDVTLPPQRVARPLLAQPAAAAASPNAWMITFTDLVALMLTFFVLLYSMSRLDIVKWQNLTGSLASSLDSVSESPAVEPKAQLDIAPVRFVPGADLDYLANVLSERLRNDERLGDVLLRNLGDRLVLSLPDPLIFDAQGQEIGAEAERTMFALGGVFRTISNSVEILAYPRAQAGSESQDARGTADETAWTGALSRAITLARLLSDAGYSGAIRPKGVAWTAGRFDAEPAETQTDDDATAPAAYRFEVIVLDSEGER